MKAKNVPVASEHDEAVQIDLAEHERPMIRKRFAQGVLHEVRRAEPIVEPDQKRSTWSRALPEARADRNREVAASRAETPSGIDLERKTAAARDRRARRAPSLRSRRRRSIGDRGTVICFVAAPIERDRTSRVRADSRIGDVTVNAVPPTPGGRRIKTRLRCGVADRAFRKHRNARIDIERVFRLRSRRSRAPDASRVSIWS